MSPVSIQVRRFAVNAKNGVKPEHCRGDSDHRHTMLVAARWQDCFAEIGRVNQRRRSK